MERAFWNGRRVLITGHTGFKGAWLALWLHSLGARVSGLALDPPSTPDLWSQLGLANIADHRGDLRDTALVERILRDDRPEVVLHLAAQSLVRPSYADPIETFSTNVMGTVTLLDAIARADHVRACVVVTSDKCYENRETSVPYREGDPMGGHDPYSASKGCTELAAASMRRSFFQPARAGGAPCRIATARAGNVIGGGDWSLDRLVPDIVRGCLGEDGRVEIRSPNAVRPWQHVLEPLHGYLLLAQALFEAREGADTGWNFGPDSGEERPVIEVARAIVAALGKGRIEVRETGANLHEAQLLQLDSARARALGWAPVWGFEKTIDLTADWYANWAAGGDPRSLCLAQIEQYQENSEAL